MKTQGLMVMLVAFALTSACNKDEFYGVTLEVEGQDALCSGGSDISSCQAISGCQPAYEDVESVEPVFASCIANPPEPEVIVAPTPGQNPPAPPAVVVEEPEAPTVKEAYESNCEDLDAQYLLVKNYGNKGSNKRVKKVKLCHQTNSGEHAIIVACPALKAHIRHADYLGACEAD